jgi:hypothetical protein
MATLKLTFLGSTALARHYRHRNGISQWVPRSVCPKTFKHGDKPGDLHEVTIEDWWLKENPFEKPVPKGQQSLL